MIPVVSLTWTLPNGVDLGFGLLKNIGNTRNSSDGNYRANLTHKMDSGSDGFFFTSTMLVLEPVDGQNLTCTGVNDFYKVKKSVVTVSTGTNNTISQNHTVRLRVIK